MFGLFKKKTEAEIIVRAPVSGKVKSLAKVKDQVFSSKMVGDGFAITPDNGHTLTPVDGTIKVAFPTGHAYGIAHKAGPELLVHIGVDTVQLNGEGFNTKVKQGSKVSGHDELAVFDLKVINKKAKSSDVIVVVTNETLTGWKIELIAKSSVKAGEPFFKLVRG